MTKDTLFLKIFVLKNWVLHESSSNQSKFLNDGKQGTKPYQIRIL